MKKIELSKKVTKERMKGEEGRGVDRNTDNTETPCCTFGRS